MSFDEKIMVKRRVDVKEGVYIWNPCLGTDEEVRSKMITSQQTRIPPRSAARMFEQQGYHTATTILKSNQHKP